MLRKKIGISIDYVIRVPEFQIAYTSLKKSLIEDFFEAKNEKNLEPDSYWSKVFSNREKVNFYEKSPIASHNDKFDYTFKKYFYNEEDRKEFFKDYSFLLYAKSESTSKKIIEFVNIIQSELCDVYLFDRVHHNRKIISTFNWLAKSSLHVKSVEFISPNDNLKEITKDFIGLYDPYQNSDSFIYSNNQQQSFIDFAFNIEKIVNPSVNH